MTAAPALDLRPARRSDPAGIRALNDATRRAHRKHCIPQPRLSLSEWSERYRVISAGTSAQHGRWRNEAVPYMVPIMDAISDRVTQEITVVAPSQSSKSEACILNPIGYFIHQQPSPILVVQPTVETAESFSKDRVAAMIRDTPVLRDRISEAKSRDTNNTILSKSFPGGQLDITGANAPSGLAMRPKRVVLLDERDRHPRSAGSEGDVKAIARARTRSFGRNRKIVEVSSPTDPITSLIWPSYLEGTREVVHIVCLECGHAQTPQFKGLKFQRDEKSGQVIPESVGYECAACEHVMPARMQREVKRRVVVLPTVEAAKTPYKRSFWIHGIVAAFHDWAEIAQEFVTANGQQDPSMRAEMLRAFFNTTLGELYIDQVMESTKKHLIDRALPYSDNGSYDVPREAAILTAGVDLQHDRGEIVVRAWGVGEVSWLVERAVLRGDTSQRSWWDGLEKYRIDRRWRHESGASMHIRSMCVDAGDGTHAKAVYTYAAPRLSQHVFAIKGHSDARASMVPSKYTRVKPGRLYVIGVHAIMERLYRRLGNLIPGPGYLYLNEYAGEAPPDGAPADYVEQLLSMQRKLDKKTGQYRFYLRDGKRNEVADCEVYAYAAFLLGPVHTSLLAAEVDKVCAEGDRSRNAAAAAVAAEGAKEAQKPTGGWLGGYTGGGWWR